MTSLVFQFMDSGMHFHLDVDVPLIGPAQCKPHLVCAVFCGHWGSTLNSSGRLLQDVRGIQACLTVFYILFRAALNPLLLLLPSWIWNASEAYLAFLWVFPHYLGQAVCGVETQSFC